MSPLRWIHGTISHWTVMLEDESLDVVTEVGAADGTGIVCIIILVYKPNILYTLPIIIYSYYRKHHALTLFHSLSSHRITTYR